MRTRLNTIKLVITICLALTLLSGNAASAADWMNNKIRGISPGMTFKEVQAIIKQQWPDATPSINYTTVKFASQKYKYGITIELNQKNQNGYEHILVHFLPPKSITADPGTNTVQRMSRSSDFKTAPLERASFVKSLITKYGPATYEDETKIKWIFKADRKILSSAKIKAMIEDREKTCKLINKEREKVFTQIRNRQKPTKSLNDLTKEFSNCRNQNNLMKRCSKNSYQEYCPYSLIYSWKTTPDTKGYVIGFHASLRGFPLESQERSRYKSLTNQLKQKALDQTKENARKGHDLKL